MKTSLFCLLFFALVLLQSCVTSMELPAMQPPKVNLLEQQLARYVTLPLVLRPIQRPSVVVIRFRVNADDELCQLEVFSQNEQLNNSLIRQLTGRKLTGYGSDLGEPYLVRLRFLPA